MNKPLFTILFVLLASVAFSQNLNKADYVEDLDFLKKNITGQTY